MVIAEVSNRYSEKFIKQYFANLIKNKFLIALTSDKYQYIGEYINKLYNIDIKKVCECIPKSLEFYKYKDKYKIIIGNKYKYKNVTVESLLRLLEFGNSEIKANKVVSEVRKDIQQTCFILYLYKIINSKSKLWQ